MQSIWEFFCFLQVLQCTTQLNTLKCLLFFLQSIYRFVWLKTFFGEFRCLFLWRILFLKRIFDSHLLKLMFLNFHKRWTTFFAINFTKLSFSPFFSKGHISKSGGSASPMEDWNDEPGRRDKQFENHYSIQCSGAQFWNSILKLLKKVSHHNFKNYSKVIY